MDVILIGFMGTGKTRVGQILARQLQVPHTDLDQVIIDTYHEPIATLFATCSEAGFRQIEHRLLVQCLCQRGVLSTGGGTAVQPQNLAFLKEAGAPIVLLEASLATIAWRIGQDKKRPLADPKTLGALQQARQKAYRQLADWVIETDDQTPTALAAQIASRLQ